MKLAVVKLSALGDIVHAMVALQFIKQAQPDSQIDWLVEQQFAGVLQDNPDIRRILTVNIKSLKRNKWRLWREIRQLRRYAGNRYDLVIDAQGLLKSALTARLLSPHTAGFDRRSIREKAAAMFYQTTVSIPYDANTIDRNAAVICTPLGITVSRQQLLHKQAFLFYREMPPQLNGLFSDSAANIVFVIGSTWPSRNYPREKYLKVIQHLDANCLICWGNDRELEAANWIASHARYVTVLPKLDLNSLKGVMAKADLVIGNDTGPTHMAWGLNRPSITLFGPTPVSRVYQTSINKVQKSSSKVDPFKLNKNDTSIGDIKVSEIVAMAQSLIE